MKIEKNCIICGQPFIAFRSSQVCCTDKCRRKRIEGQHALAKEKKARKEKVQEEKEIRDIHSNIDEINAEARRKGLSYGRLQAMKYMKEKGI